jgi:adenylate cyclase
VPRLSPARRRLLIAAGLGLGTAALLAAAWSAGYFASTAMRGIDLLFRTRTVEPARATVIVAIDQPSYRELLPRHGAMVDWPRALYARVLDRLREAGARVVFFDIFFDAPRPDDPELIAAMGRAGNVVMPVEAQGPGALAPAPGVAQEFQVFVRPHAALREAAAAEGFVNVTTDPDTVVRSLPLVLRAGGAEVPAAALTIAARFVRRRSVIDGPPEPGVVYAAGRAIPTVEWGRMRINYLGPPTTPEGGGPVAMLSFADVLAGRFDAALVRDRIALVGLAIRGIDEHSTPTTAETRMWGVEILASAVETILTDHHVVVAPAGVGLALIVAAALAAALVAAAWRLSRAIAAAAVLVVAYLGGAMLAFDGGTILDPVYPPLAVAAAFGVTLAYRVVFEEAEQRRVRGVIARYLSPSVSQWVLADASRLNLGGETREMTVLFSDLRGFTTLSHRLEPRLLVELLNEYMTAMTEVVFRHDGVLDKYIGDAIMAFWNAPADQPDHARRACATALDMVATLEALCARWERRGWPRLELGIGINTGPMIVGDMGSRERLAYTVMGDPVNVASRLEGLSKVYGVRLVIGEATRAAAGDAFAWRYLDRVAVKGRAEPLTIHEALGPREAVTAETAALLGAWEAGVRCYLERRWAEAAAAFDALAGRAPDDGPSRLYRGRALAMLANPPGDDWNGVWVADTK